MDNTKSMEVFSKAPVSKAVLKNALPAMVAMLMVLVYNLADTFFIGQTHDALQVAAVSLATPVFLIFMTVGTVFGIGGTSVISRDMGEGRHEYAKKVSAFCMWSCVAVGSYVNFYGCDFRVGRCKRRYLELCPNLSDNRSMLRSVRADFKLLF